jgi:hypothetical protein
MNKMERKIKFVCNAVKWFDKINGNTYYSVRITNCEKGQTIVPKTAFEYGYGDQYRYTALKCMLEKGWIDSKYNENLVYMYEREHNYPIMWNCIDGLKRDMIANSTL